MCTSYRTSYSYLPFVDSDLNWVKQRSAPPARLIFLVVEAGSVWYPIPEGRFPKLKTPH